MYIDHCIDYIHIFMLLYTHIYVCFFTNNVLKHIYIYTYIYIRKFAYQRHPPPLELCCHGPLLYPTDLGSACLLVSWSMWRKRPGCSWNRFEVELLPFCVWPFVRKDGASETAPALPTVVVRSGDLVHLDQSELMTPENSWNATSHGPVGVPVPLPPDRHCHEECGTGDKKGGEETWRMCGFHVGNWTPRGPPHLEEKSTTFSHRSTFSIVFTALQLGKIKQQ